MEEQPLALTPCAARVMRIHTTKEDRRNTIETLQRQMPAVKTLAGHPPFLSAPSRRLLSVVPSTP